MNSNVEISTDTVIEPEIPLDTFTGEDLLELPHQLHKDLLQSGINNAQN